MQYNKSITNDHIHFHRCATQWFNSLWNTEFHFNDNLLLLPHTHSLWCAAVVRVCEIFVCLLYLALSLPVDMMTRCNYTSLITFSVGWLVLDAAFLAAFVAHFHTSERRRNGIGCAICSSLHFFPSAAYQILSRFSLSLSCSVLACSRRRRRRWFFFFTMKLIFVLNDSNVFISYGCVTASVLHYLLLVGVLQSKFGLTFKGLLFHSTFVNVNVFKSNLECEIIFCWFAIRNVPNVSSFRSHYDYQTWRYLP